MKDLGGSASRVLVHDLTISVLPHCLTYFYLLFLKFYWRLFDLKCCVSFRYAAKGFRHIYINLEVRVQDWSLTEVWELVFPLYVYACVLLLSCSAVSDSL